MDIGAKLGIHYVLEGSVQKLPAELRVTAALIKVETGHVVWSDDFDRKLNINSVLQLKDDITEKIVIAIAPSYGAMYRDTLNYIKRHETDSFFAYDCVLHAMAYRERGGSKALPEIIECLEKSVATDPHYSKAWAFLSIIYLHEYLVGFDPEMFDFDTEKRGYDAALRAVDEDSQSALGYSALSSAYFFRQDLELFRWYGSKAIGLNPNDVAILANFGAKIAMAGEWDVGIPMIRKAIALNPAHADWYYVPIGFYHYAMGEYRLAEIEIGKIRHVKHPVYYLLRAIV